jgi:hypothetical protein
LNLLQTDFGNFCREDWNHGRLGHEEDQHAARGITSGNGNRTSAFSHNSGFT